MNFTLSMIPDITYIFLAVFLLQFFNFEQIAMSAGRTIELTLITCLYGLYAVSVGKVFPIDSVTVALLIVMGIMLLSLFWTDSHRSAFEVITWASYFLLFMVCRTVPIEITLFITLACASIFAGFQIYNQFRPKPAVYDDKPANHWSFMYVFGNNNHNGAYLMLHVPVGLYLTVTGHPWAIIPTCMIALAVVLTRCYGALAGLFMSLFAMLVYTYGWWMLLIIGAGVFCALSVPLIGHDHRLPLVSDNKTASFKARVLLWYQAWLIFRQKWCFGWGMDMYRKVLPFVAPQARKNETIKGFITDIGGMERNIGHRAHNDHLEILVELGVVGYLAFLWLFFQMPVSLLSVGVLMAVSVNALFFFPLRETHIAVPFWAIMGAVAFSIPSPVEIPVVVKFALVGAILAILAVCHRKFMGLYHYDKATQTEDINEKRALLVKALHCDPYNGQYLNAYAFNCPRGSIANYDAAARAMWHYDGDGVMWQTWEQYARSIVAINHLGVAHCTIVKALEINPESVTIAGLKAEIEAFVAQQMQPPPEPAPFKPIKIINFKRRK